MIKHSLHKDFNFGLIWIYNLCIYGKGRKCLYLDYMLFCNRMRLDFVKKEINVCIKRKGDLCIKDERDLLDIVCGSNWGACICR